MKIFKITGAALASVVACIAFWSCSSDNSLTGDVLTEDDGMAVLSIGLSGDISVTESPLTRAVDDGDLCGIVVKENQQNYAYGLFEKETVTSGNLKLSVKKGCTYTFEASLVKNGKNVLAKDGEMYGLPFNAPVNTEFVMSDAEAPLSISSGRTELLSGIYDHPAIERHHGVVTFTPNADGSLEIPLKMACYGVKFTTENFTEGSLLISLEGSPDITMTFDASSATPTSPSTEAVIYTFKNPDDFCNASDYTETVNISAVWTKADGTTKTTLVNAKPIEVGNNVSTLHINVGGDPVNGAMTVSDPSTDTMGGEDTPMTITPGQGNIVVQD